jgi:predicted NBD/HSP70 family sugar kinase
MNVLVLDIGGSHVRMLATGQGEPVRFESGKHLTPDDLMARVRKLTADWKYDVVALGYPGPVGPRGPTVEAGNLGGGWVGHDFQRAFARPVRVVNDAAMQALGAYEGGRMLFLGLGTGLGSALVSERVLVPLELGSLPYCARDMEQKGTKIETIGERLSKEGRKEHGQAAWLRCVHIVTGMLQLVFRADYIVLGGGNAQEVDPLPAKTRRGGNDDAFTGGFRLWEELVEPHDQPTSEVWRVAH